LCKNKKKSAIYLIINGVFVKKHPKALHLVLFCMDNWIKMAVVMSLRQQPFDIKTLGVQVESWIVQ